YLWIRSPPSTTVHRRTSRRMCREVAPFLSCEPRGVARRGADAHRTSLSAAKPVDALRQTRAVVLVEVNEHSAAPCDRVSSSPTCQPLSPRKSSLVATGPHGGSPFSHTIVTIPCRLASS